MSNTNEQAPWSANVRPDAGAAAMSDDEDDEVCALDCDDENETVFLLPAKYGVDPTVQKVPVSRKVANAIPLVKTALEENATETEVPLISVNEQFTHAFVRFVQQKLTHGKPKYPTLSMGSTRMADLTDPWAAAWVNDDMCRGGKTTVSELCAAVTCANYLGLNDAMHLLCVKVSSLVKGQRPEMVKPLLAPNATVEERPHIPLDESTVSEC